MNFDDLKDQVLSSLKNLWERIQDSSLYHQLRDRFENLTPQYQKIVIALSAAFVAFVILSIPYSYWSESAENVAGFEDRRDLTRRLLKSSREAADIPNIPVAPSPDALKTELEATLRNIQLVDEQLKSVEVTGAESNLIPQEMAQGGVTVQLAQLNLQQIVDIGYRLTAVSPSVKMTSMQISPNRQNAQYFDVVFKLISLAVPEFTPPPAPEVNEAPSRGSRPKFRRGTQDED